MRIVIVNPRIWKVNVIGIGTPPLQRIPEKTARRCFGALWGSKRTLTILPDQSKNVNLRRLCPLDKSKVSGIIKVTKDASTSGRPRLVYEVKKMFLKPSLCRVAVSPVNADRNSQSKDMESQCDRHRNTPFTEDSGENRPSLFWRPWGSKRTIPILPDRSKNVNQWRMLCHWQKKSMAFYTTGGRCR